MHGIEHYLVPYGTLCTVPYVKIFFYLRVYIELHADTILLDGRLGDILIQKGKNQE